MKKLKIGLAGLLIVPVLALGAGLATSQSVEAQGLDEAMTTIEGSSASSAKGVDSDLVVTIINWMLFAIGIVAVIMLIYGGFLYATSAGDSNKVTNAKNTILYAIIGLVIAILAFAIVQFIVNSFK